MNKQHHVVVGGGITGLTLAWQLQRRYGNQIQITLLEKENRFGGWLQTNRYGDFLFEKGPHSCRAQGGQPALELIEMLGLCKELIHADSSANWRYLYTNKQLLALPRLSLASLRSPLIKPLLTGLLTEWNASPNTGSEESVHAWTTRRLGPWIAEHLMDPLMRGIFAGNSRTLSMEACLPTFIEKERAFGSLTRALLFAPFRRQTSTQTYSPWVNTMISQGIFTLRQGWGQLIERLITHLTPTTTLRTHVELVSITQDKERSHLIFQNGEHLTADIVYLTTPAHASARVLQQAAPQAASLLRDIPFQDVLVAHVGFHHPVLRQKGFGHLVPTWEDQDILGMVWDSSLFPQQNDHLQQTRLTVMLNGGVNQPEQRIHEALLRHLGISAKPDILQVHPLSKAIAQYTLGHLSRVRRAREFLQQTLPQVKLLGNSYDGISLPASIAKARDVAWGKDAQE